MHLPGRQVDPQQVRRDLWRLASGSGSATPGGSASAGSGGAAVTADAGPAR